MALLNQVKHADKLSDSLLNIETTPFNRPTAHVDLTKQFDLKALFIGLSHARLHVACAQIGLYVTIGLIGLSIYTYRSVWADSVDL